MPPKMGRPLSDNPKDTRITVRINKDTNNILQKYCKQENVDKAEVIRRGINKLKADIQEN